MSPASDPGDLGPDPIEVWHEHAIIARWPSDFQFTTEPPHSVVILDPDGGEVARYGRGDYSAVARGLERQGLCAFITPDARCPRHTAES